MQNLNVDEKVQFRNYQWKSKWKFGIIKNKTRKNPNYKRF